MTTALDVFGIHALGGALGAILTGVFTLKAIGGTAGLLEGNAAQVKLQLIRCWCDGALHNCCNLHYFKSCKFDYTFKSFGY